MPELANDVNVVADAMTAAAEVFLQSVVKRLVAYPDRVQVDHMVKADAVLILLRVASEDVGRVIGEQGRTAHSLRTVLQTLGRKSRQPFELHIQQNEQVARG